MRVCLRRAIFSSVLSCNVSVHSSQNKKWHAAGFAGVHCLNVASESYAKTFCTTLVCSCRLCSTTSSKGLCSDDDRGVIEFAWGEESNKCLYRGRNEQKVDIAPVSPYKLFGFTASSRDQDFVIPEPCSVSEGGRLSNAMSRVVKREKSPEKQQKSPMDDANQLSRVNKPPPCSSSQVEGSPLRQLIVSEHSRRKNKATVGEKIEERGERKGQRNKGSNDNVFSVFHHPCQFQSGGPPFCSTQLVIRSSEAESRSGGTSFIENKSALSDRVLNAGTSCPYVHHPSVCCLSSCGGKGGGVTVCRSGLLGMCPWHHGAVDSIHRRLVEALFTSIDEICPTNISSSSDSFTNGNTVQKNKDSLGECLKHDAEAAGASLSVFVDAAVVAMEVMGNTSNTNVFSLDAKISDGERSEKDDDAWGLLISAVRQYSQTSDGSYVRCIDPAYLLPGGVEQNLSRKEVGKKQNTMLFAVETSLLNAAVTNSTTQLKNPDTEWNRFANPHDTTSADFTATTTKGYQETKQWWYGPICSSVLHPSPSAGPEASSGLNDGTFPAEGFMILSPLLQGWLLDQVREELGATEEQCAGRGSDQSPTEIIRKRLGSAMHALLLQRLRVCDQIGGHSSKLTWSDHPIKSQVTWYDYLGNPAENALCFLRDAVAWSLLRIANDSDDGENEIVSLVASSPSLYSPYLSEEDRSFNVNDALIEQDPATAALSGLSRSTSDWYTSCSSEDAMKRSSYSFSFFSSFFLDWRSRSQSSLFSSEGGVQEAMEAVDRAWETLHSIILKVYHILLSSSVVVDHWFSGDPRRTARELNSITRSARVSFLVQPAFIFLCFHHSHALDILYGEAIRSSLGWTPWTDTQMFGMEDQEMMYTPMKYARHHLPWLSFSCCHSLLNGLLLSTLLHSEGDSGLVHRSAIKQHLLLHPSSSLILSRDGSPQFANNEWSHRERVAVLTPFLLLSNGFLDALHDVGVQLKQVREVLTQTFESRRHAYNSKCLQERDNNSPYSRDDFTETGGGVTSVNSSRTRRYNEETWRKMKELQQQERDAASTPLLDRLLPYGSCIVSSEATSRLLRQWLEGGTAYRGLRVAAGMVQTMRLLRRAANAPLPTLEQTTKIVHKRVQSKKNPYKKHLIQVRVPTHRLVVEGGAERFYERDDDLKDSRSRKASDSALYIRESSAFPLVYQLSETVVEEIARLSLRMGTAGSRLIDGVLRECVDGNVLNFFGTVGRTNFAKKSSSTNTLSVDGCKGRALTYPSVEEIGQLSTSSLSWLFSSTRDQPSLLNSDLTVTHHAKQNEKRISFTTSSSASHLGIVRQVIGELLDDSASRGEIMRPFGGGDRRRERKSLEGSFNQGVLVASRVPPTAEVMETALSHSGIQSPTSSKSPETFTAESPSTSGNIGHAVFGYILTDPVRFICPDVLLAVQGSRTHDNTHQAMGGLYCTLHCINDFFNQRKYADPVSPLLSAAQKMLGGDLARISQLSDFSDREFFRFSYSTSNAFLTAKKTSSSVSSLAKEFLLRAEHKNPSAVFQGAGERDEAVGRKTEAYREAQSIKAVRNYLGLVRKSDGDDIPFDRMNQHPHERSFPHHELVSVLLSLPDKTLYGLIIECCCVSGSGELGVPPGRPSAFRSSPDRFLHSGWSLCAASSMALTPDDVNRSHLAMKMGPSVWRWTLGLGVLLAHSPVNYNLPTNSSSTTGLIKSSRSQVFHQQQYWMDASSRVLLLSELFRMHLPMSGNIRNDNSSLSCPKVFPFLSSTFTPVLDTFPSLVIIQVLLGRHLFSKKTCDPRILHVACEAHLRDQGIPHDTAAVANHLSTLKIILDQFQECVLKSFGTNNNSIRAHERPKGSITDDEDKVNPSSETIDENSETDLDENLRRQMVRFITKGITVYSHLWKFTMEPELLFQGSASVKVSDSDKGITSHQASRLLIAAHWLLYTILTPTNAHQQWVYRHLHRLPKTKPQDENNRFNLDLLSHKLFHIWHHHSNQPNELSTPLVHRSNPNPTTTP